MQISKEFKIGLFSVITIAMLYLGFNFLKGIDFFSTTDKYYAVYPNINGLTKSNAVIIKGLTVGRVSDITFEQGEQHRIIVELSIEGDIVLDDSTIAYLVSEGLLGDKAIELRIPSEITNPLKNGDTLKSEVSMGLIESLTEQTGPVADDASALIRKLNTFLDSLLMTEKVIRETFNSTNNVLDQTQSMVRKNRDDLNESIKNINNLTTKLNESAEILNRTLTKTDVFVGSLNELELENMVNNLSRTSEELNEMIHQLNKGEGTMGHLMKDDSLYVNLNRSVESLDKLLVDFRENPKRYVHFSIFGRKDKSDKK